MEGLNIILLIGVLLFVPYLLGTLFIGQTKSRQYINGVLLLFGLFLVNSIWAVKANMNLTEMSNNFNTILIIAVVFAVIFQIIFILYRALKNKEKKKMSKRLFDKSRIMECAGIAAAFLFVAITFFIYSPLLESRFMMPETVVTMLETNSLSGFNPLTGELIEVSGSLKENLYSLPGFYAWMAINLQLDVLKILFQIVPVWILFISFLVFYQFSQLFFKESNKARIIFMWAYALVILFGDMAYMNEAYQMLHYAYEGTTILACILLPYCLYLLFQMFFCENNIESKKKAGIILRFVIELLIILTAGVMVTVRDFGIGLLAAMIGIVLIVRLAILTACLLRKVKEKVWQR